MNWYYNMKITGKLTVAFMAMALITAAVGVYGVINLVKIDDLYSTLIDKSVDPLAEVGVASVAFQRIRIDAGYLTAPDITKEEEVKDINSIKELKETVSKNIESLSKTIITEEGKAIHKTITERLNAYYGVLSKVLQLVSDGKRDEARKLQSGEARAVAGEVREALDKFAGLKVKVAQKMSDEYTALGKAATKSIIAVTAFGALIALGLGVFIARIISRPVKEITDVANKLATGDVNVDIEAKTKDEIGQLTNAVKVVIENIKENALAASRIAKGDLTASVKQKSEKDVMAQSINAVIKNLQALVSDADMLAKAAVEGKLATRADAAKHEGDYRKIVDGVNKTLDAVIGPLNVAAGYVDKISKGIIPPTITDTYNGDFNVIKGNLNLMIEAERNITEIAQQIAGGNLIVKAKERSGEDELMRALSTMIAKLTDIVSNVTAAAGNVASGSTELSSSSQQLSQGATEQASAAEESSSSMEQMTANIKQNSDNAMQTEKIAQNAAEKARESGKSVTE
ncbi:MAG: MCP four helix bundle domain-containing protein, partial [Nitrospirae bacterium]|nr:MCP four helix bundle domain-containing protein [Nitrospirota bacterium]